jgi:Predicted transcriptional regulators
MRIDRIKFVMEITKQDLTLVELAKRSGVNRVTLSNIKCGKSCTSEIGHKIAKALNVKVQDLLED